MRWAKPLDDRRLADPGLTDQHGIVLRAAGQHLDDAADFLVSTDDRCQLALAGQLREVAAVFLKGFVLVLGVLVGDPLAAANGGQRLENPFA